MLGLKLNHVSKRGHWFLCGQAIDNHMTATGLVYKGSELKFS